MVLPGPASRSPVAVVPGPASRSPRPKPPVKKKKFEETPLIRTEERKNGRTEERKNRRTEGTWEFQVRGNPPNSHGRTEGPLGVRDRRLPVCETPKKAPKRPKKCKNYQEYYNIGKHLMPLYFALFFSLKNERIFVGWSAHKGVFCWKMVKFLLTVACYTKSWNYNIR